MKTRYITTTIALMLLAATVTCGVTLYTMEHKYNDMLDDFNRREQEYSKIAEVRGYIEKYFVNDYSEEDISNGALAGMVAYLGDKWSYYLNPEQFASFNNSLNSKVVGIGVSAAYDADTGGILIYDVYADSPAEKVGLIPLDVIIKVDGVSVTELGYDAAVDKVRGEEGTSVVLTVYHGSAKQLMDITVTRQNVKIENIRSQILGNLGYIRINSFDLNVDKTFNEALDKLTKANVKGIIFDVRNNPGGSLQTLLNMLDPLLPEGMIISEKTKDGVSLDHKSDAQELKLPMAVIVNERSISAAEFFAASLQEYGKAVIVGSCTTGKGVAQTPIKLSDGSGLILSTSKYFTAKGKSLVESNGLTPDRVVDLTEAEQVKFYKMTPAEDRQLQAAIAAINEKIS